jgi:uncharacterized protein YndB with AHSA1/START domain
LFVRLDPMRTFSITIDIGAPAERVWQVMSDTDRWHEWTPSVTSIRRLESGPLAVGGRAVIRQPTFPPAWWTITDIEPGRSFTWVSTGPGIRAVARHWIEPTGSGSQATLSLELQGIFGELFGRMTKGITERYLAFEARGLKARSETPGFRHGGTNR